ncbi:hypothetical protein KKD62_00180 [Patescibacteria group bacterium]|nr:hypothetical protein [Patescibacteria group bacterium]MBU1931888.1 hypothetical protein [Patescibacteria group bacterium]
MNLVRPWMGGQGAYSTNFARWISSSERHSNEGVMTRLNYQQHYPGHELSYDLFYPEGFRFWLTPWENELFGARFKPNTKYQIKLRYKITNLAGPRNPAHPYGFVIKTHGFLSHETGLEATEEALRGKPSIIDHVNVNQGWHT